MRGAYVDPSCLLALSFDERGAAAIAHRIASFDTVVSSNLLEAEFLAAMSRIDREPDWINLARIQFLFPERSLRPEISKVLAEGNLRGADCWHLANALYFAGPQVSSISFLTLDVRQKDVAKALGFAD